MLASFADQATRDVYDGEESRAARAFPKAIWPIAQRKLDMLNAAKALKDLKSPPGNRLKTLKGDLAGYYSIRVNDQYRVIFKFADGNASAVKLTDYH